MAQDGYCTLCGRSLEDPSEASVCPRCLLLEVRHLLAEEDAASGVGGVPAEADRTVPGPYGWAAARDSGRSVPHASFEAPGRYTEMREHARGGMGRILLAHDEQLGRDIVIKELLGGRMAASATPRPVGHLAESTPPADRFVREARIAGQLEHPSIIPVHELGFRENGDLYYTMKYVQGVSLAESLERTVNLEERLRLLPHVLDVCQAIAYAHSRGVIHRDIKPANIMVGEFGETVVLDWGLARVKGVPPDEPHEGAPGKCAPIDLGCGENGHTNFGEVLGTPAYMAPEQAQGRAHSVDERTDVYALGALLYTLLTRKPPYTAETRAEIIHRAATGTPEPVRTLERVAPAELVAICEKAMAQDPAQRYPSAKALAEELQRFLSGGLVSAYAYGLSEHLWRMVRRNKKVATTIAIAFIVVNAVAIYSYLHILGERNSALEARNEAVQAKDEATQARDEATQSREQAEQEAYYRAIAYAHAKIQKGDFAEVPKVLEGLPERFRGWEWGYLMGQCHLEEKSVQAHEGAITAFAASRDGSLIATAGEDGKLILWDGKTLTQKWAYPYTIGITALALAPDGMTLAAGSDGLLVLDCQTGNVIKNTIPLRYDSDHMQEFAMSVKVTGAPEGGDTGCVRFYPTSGQYPSSREYGQSPFPLQNGDHIVRINLRDAEDPARATYSGAIYYYRITLPAPDKPKNFETYRDMRVEIDWIAITDDPAFIPVKSWDENSSHEEANPLFAYRAVWNFENDLEGWATGKNNGTVITHEDGKLVMTFEPAVHFAPSVRLVPSHDRSPIESMTFHPDGTLFYQLVDNHLRILRTSDWEIQTEIADVQSSPVPDPRATAITLSPDGTQIVAGATISGPEGSANYYRGFDTSTYEPLWEFHESSIDTKASVKLLDLAFDPAGQHLLCVGDGWIGLRDLTNGTIKREWQEYVDPRSVRAPKAIWMDQKHFLIGGRDGTVALFNIENDKRATLLQNPSKISGLVVHSDDGRLTTIDLAGVMSSWIPDGASPMPGAVDLHVSDCFGGFSPQFSSDGKFLAAWVSKAGLALWDMGSAVRSSTPFSGDDSLLGFRPGTDEAALLVNRGRTVRFRGIGDGRVIREIPLSGPLASDTFAMDGTGTYMALATDMGRNTTMPVQVFEISTGRKLDPEIPVNTGGLALSQDGRHLAIDRKFEGRVEIWSVPDCLQQQTLVDTAEGPYALRGMHSMAFHPEEEFLAAATGTGRLLIWNYLTGALVRAVPAKNHGVTSVCFSPDGKRLVTGGDDGTVRVWDWRTGQQVLILQDNYMVRGVAFSPDGSMLASGGGDPPLRVRVAWPRSATFLPDIQRRRNCHVRLIALDDAKLAWAIANGRPPEDASAAIPDLQPYLTEPASPLTCLSGGEYRLGAVQELPSCSIHGAPWENSSLQQRVEAITDEDAPLVNIFVARLIASKNARELGNLASQWEEQDRHLPLAIRIFQRSLELAPEVKVNWRLLAYTELRLDLLDDAVAHFREGLEPNHEPSAVGLALALITRGTEQDLTEACAVLEAQAGTAPTVYTEDALKTLDELPATTDAQLRERIRTLLSAHLTP